MEVKKTYKLYIGGKFPRTESGQYSELRTANGDLFANICKASRKDLREAAVAARAAFSGWSNRTSYNRGQILYRVAEMIESRRTALLSDLKDFGVKSKEAARYIDEAINLWVHYAGWCDKYGQLNSTVNDVQGPFFNFSIPEPVGVVGVQSESNRGILDISHALIPALVSGNTTILIVEGPLRHMAIELAEIIAVSDVPAGVVNILTVEEASLDEHLFTHMDINALFLATDSKDRITKAKQDSISNLKRLHLLSDTPENSAKGSLHRIKAFTETKTIWHPNLA